MPDLGIGMLENEEDEARAIDRIVEVGSGATVGLIYVWEDGEEQPLWFDGEKSDVIVLKLQEALSGRD